MQYRMIITSNEFKKELLKEQDLHNPIKIISINEAIDELTFKLDYEMVIEVAKRFDLTYSIASLYLTTIRTLIPGAKLTDRKLQPLFEIVEFLKEEKYLGEIDPLLLKKRTLILKGYKEDFSLLVRLLDYYKIDYQIEYIQRKPRAYVVDEYIDKNEEVIESLNRIADLLYENNDVKLSDISILATDSYHLLIKAVANLFSLKVIEEKTRLIDLPFYRNVRRKLEDGSYKIKDLEELTVSNSIEQLVVNNLISFAEDVSSLQVPIKLLLSYFDQRFMFETVPGESDGINLISSLKSHTKFLFIIGFNEDLFSPIRDVDFLDDPKKELLSFEPTSYIKNSERTDNFLTRLSNFAFVNISYVRDKEKDPLFELDGKLFIKRIASVQNKRFSRKADLFLAAGYDLNERVFHLHHPLGAYLKGLNLGKLNSYDNSFKGKVNSELASISYSSIKTYFACPFSYFVDKCLKLSEIEDPFNINLGSIFHQILERYIKEGSWDFSFDKSAYDLQPKDIFYIDKLLAELEENKPFIEMVISSFKGYEASAEYSFKYPLTPTIDLLGRYDLVLSNEDSYLVIDYKTGSEVFTYQAVEAGFSLQLPIYSLVAREEFKGKTSLGAFIFPVVKEEQSDLKLLGYTPNASKLCLTLGEDYKTVVRVGKNGYALSTNEEDSMLSGIDERLKEAIYRIEEGDFKISPATYGTKYDACRYCCYRDICFVKESQKKTDFSSEECEDE